MNAEYIEATVFVINPGSTSTQVALFERAGELWREEVYHRPEELSLDAIGQLDLRRTALEPHLVEHIPAGSLAAVMHYARHPSFGNSRQTSLDL